MPLFAATIYVGSRISIPSKYERARDSEIMWSGCDYVHASEDTPEGEPLVCVFEAKSQPDGTPIPSPPDGKALGLLKIWFEHDGETGVWLRDLEASDGGEGAETRLEPTTILMQTERRNDDQWWLPRRGVRVEVDVPRAGELSIRQQVGDAVLERRLRVEVRQPSPSLVEARARLQDIAERTRASELPRSSASDDAPDQAERERDELEGEERRRALAEELDALIDDIVAERAQAPDTTFDQLLWWDLLRRAYYRRGRHEESAREAHDLSEQAHALHQVSLACRASVAEGYIHHQELAEDPKALGAAWGAYARAHERCPSRDADSWINMLHAVGTGYLLDGDYLHARQAFERKVELAARLDLGFKETSGLEGLILAQQHLGAWAVARDAQQRLERVRTRGGRADGSRRYVCEDRLRTDFNILVATLHHFIHHEEGEPPVEELTSLLEGWKGCGHEAKQTHGIRLTLAEAHLARGTIDDLARGGRVLDEIQDPRELQFADRVWYQELRVAFAIRSQHTLEAEESLVQLRDVIAEQGEDPETSEWRLHLLDGEFHEHVGSRDQAIAAYAKAESIAERDLVSVALGVGQDRHVEIHRQSARRLVDALLDDGQIGAALCAARRARSRAGRVTAVRLRYGAELAAAVPDPLAEPPRATAVRSPAERATAMLSPLVLARWRSATAHAAYDRMRTQTHQTPSELDLERRAQERRAADEALEAALDAHAVDPALVGTGECSELRSPDPGEVLLVFYPLEHEMAAFAWADGQSPRAARTSKAASPQQLIDVLGDAFADAPSQVTIMAADETAALDFGAMHWPGSQDTLLERALVVHSLDMGSSHQASSAASRRRVAIVDADSEDSLPAELHEAVGRLHADHTLRLGRDAAIPAHEWLASVSRHIARSDTLLFVGHAGLFDPMGYATTVRDTGVYALVLDHGFDDRVVMPHDTSTSADEDFLGDHANHGHTLYRSMDVLAEADVPRRVLLVACRGAEPGEIGGLAGNSLAQTFLVRGTRTFLGASDLIRPETGRQLVEALDEGVLVEALDERRFRDALRLAILEVRRQGNEDWSKLRIWGP
ncbi:MAG: hypothetical protein KDK70_00790 [Myxococcales bacterium]|nr:hypothetical protein [Myxococcales bacterium]